MSRRTRSVASTERPLIFTSSASEPPNAACASASRRSPGVATSTTTATPGRSCAAPTIRPSGWCSTSFHALVAQDGPVADPLDSERPDLSRPDRGRAEARHGLSVVEPALPLLSGTGRPAARAISWPALHATGFDGLLSLEIFNDRFRAGSARSVAVDGQRSLIVMLDELRRTTGVGASRPARPAAAPTVSGVEFVEFAMDETQRDGVRGNARRALGFRQGRRPPLEGRHALAAGRHQHRGERDKEGFAHSFNITHGASVCAHGAARRRRARRRSSGRSGSWTSRSARPVGPGELDIPAVRGLGRKPALLRRSAGAISTASGTSISSPPLKACRRGGRRPRDRFDHVSQAMHYEEMLTWLLFYTSLLDVRRRRCRRRSTRAAWCRARWSRASDGALPLVLNASQSRQTLSSRFLNELFGSGVQHIALRDGRHLRHRRAR